MKISYPLSKRFAFSILAIQFLVIHSVSSLNLTNEYLKHKCLLDQGKYTVGSKYEKNLNGLFRYISNESFFRSDFLHITEGMMTPDPVTVVVLCRGDTTGSECRTCANSTVVEFLKRCPMNKGGIVWYEQCYLIVSMINEETPDKTDYENFFSIHNPKNVRGDGKLFAKHTMDLFSALLLRMDLVAKDGMNIVFYTAGTKKLGKNKLYAMMQCLGSTIDCRGCLAWSITKIFTNGHIKQGARVHVGTSCNIRYELYPFLRS